MRYIRALVRRILRGPQESSDRIAINLGRILARENDKIETSNLQHYGFGIFSQWDEDGIIQKLSSSIPEEARTFIEIGVEDYVESNTRFLMMKDNWRGFVVDGSAKNIQKIRNSYYYWRYDLEAHHAFVDLENINRLVNDSGIGENLGILSIDIDGVDYHVLKEIVNCRPHILVVEYNAVFGPHRQVTVPYRSDFNRTKAHYSNIYWGASLAAMNSLANSWGLCLVGTNKAGNNAFFIRHDNPILEQFPGSLEEKFTASRFRESRDRKGALNYLSPSKLGDSISHLPLVEVGSRRRCHE
jgi:hypothetical protein